MSVLISLSYIPLFLSVCISLSLSLFLVSMSLGLSVTLSVYPCLYVSFSLSFCISVSGHCLCLCSSDCLCHLPLTLCSVLVTVCLFPLSWWLSAYFLCPVNCLCIFPLSQRLFVIYNLSLSSVPVTVSVLKLIWASCLLFDHDPTG